jgi:hypothetical protein
MAKSAWQSSAAVAAIESSTGCSWFGDRLITLSTSLVAVCCSSDSLSFFSRSRARAFSVFISAAWGSLDKVTGARAFVLVERSLRRSALWPFVRQGHLVGTSIDPASRVLAKTITRQGWRCVRLFASVPRKRAGQRATRGSARIVAGCRFVLAPPLRQGSQAGAKRKPTDRTRPPYTRRLHRRYCDGRRTGVAMAIALTAARCGATAKCAGGR